MLLTDIYFFFSIITLAVLVTIAAFYWKQLWWVGLLGGFLWILLGLWGINNAHNPVISFQRELAIVFIVIGIGVFFLPFYKSIVESFDELDEYNNEMTDHQRQLNRLRKATRRNFRGED
jgi:uncharacterized membrane protein